MARQHNENQSIGRLISILHRKSYVYFHRKLSSYGLGYGQMPVLMYIIHHEGVTQHDISEHFRLDKGSTSNLVKGLTRNGYLFRKQDETDKRVNRLYITDKTKKLLPEFYEIFRGWTEILLEGFSQRDQDKAFELLNRMLDNTRSSLKGEELQ